MKAWDSFWKKFDALMDAMPDAIEDAASGGVPGVVSTQITNGHVSVNGHLKSLKINGYTVRVPEHVMRGKS
jgi:hypothetical protein